MSALIRKTALLLNTTSFALLLGGCHVDLSGLNQLFSSDPTYLSLPGTRIGSGRYSYVSIVGTNASGAYVIGVDDAASPPALALFPFKGGKACRTAPVYNDDYRPLDFGVRSTVPAIVGYHERTDQGTLLHLTTLDCKEPLPPILDSNYPINATFDDPPGYLALDANRNLLFAEPWNGRQTTVAEKTRGVHVFQDKVWAIEGSHLVVRNKQLEMLAQFGTNVTEYDFTNSGAPRVVYVDATCAPGSSPCEGDLYVVTDALEEPQKIDSDACAVSFPSRWGGLGVSYRSPCVDRTDAEHPANGRLVVYGSTKLSDPGPGMSDQRIVVGDSILGTPDVDFLQNVAYAFYVKAADPKAVNGELWAGKLGESLAHIADSPTRDSRGGPLVDKAGAGFRFQADFDDKGTRLGRLVTWKPGSPTVEIASGVAQIAGPVAIVNFDGTVGDLIGLHGSAATKPLARRVPKQQILVDTPGIAVVTDYDGTSGTLRVAPGGTTDFEKVAPRVSPTEAGQGQIAFLQSLNAIGYLHDFDEDTQVGTLGVRIIETGDTFDIGIRASEWGEYGWPEPGILYVSPEGNAAGIWFARLR